MELAEGIAPLLWAIHFRALQSYHECERKASTSPSSRETVLERSDEDKVQEGLLSPGTDFLLLFKSTSRSSFNGSPRK
eukprot:CAMPEP_0170628990 /NCGR_PEP_ID=MMETSP0224-20130122/33047_1 /TAXON_ID=285029 /ORGANISM="Togula jolla, Strain CCCM 725" /LENGTH=77 /DNA_ID=CAMNT_0010956589 /DNA_START=351 /DNA_END=585 /DNA_ORIENTATION=-